MLNTNLLSTVYRQYWPVPGWGHGPVSDDTTDRPKLDVAQRQNIKTYTKQSRSSSNRNKISTKHNEKHARESPVNNGTSFSKLDKETLQRIGWANRVQTTETLCHGPPKKELDDLPRQLTKAEFRRLSDQVREVSMEFSRRFRPASTIQKSYQVSGQPVCPPGKNSTRVYRTQLAASLRVFEKRIREPLEVEEIVNCPVSRCRPTSSYSDNRKEPLPPRTGFSSAEGKRRPTRLARPRSVPARSYHSSTGNANLDPQPGYFDTLDPQLLSCLVIEKRPQSAYGDRVPSLGSLASGGSPSENATPRKEDKVSEDVSSTSGLESILTDDSDTSDGEAGKGEEPTLESPRHIPQMSLRPEKWDAVYSPPDRNDPRRFDFDAETVELPEYEFADPLPDYCAGLDLQAISSGQSPFNVVTRDAGENRFLVQLIKRLADIDKYQAETVDAEKRKKDKQKQSMARPRLLKTSSFISKDNSCSSECLQIACTGNCPCKKTQPDRCGHQLDVTSSLASVDAAYELRMRLGQRPNDDAKVAERVCRPKSCNSCKKVHTAKYINANNVLLGRPRSGHSTYSSGQGSSKPKDLRAKGMTPLPTSVVKDFEKLGMKTNKPSYCQTQLRPKGRSAVLPGKSFFSQRRESLTKSGMKQRLNVMASRKVTSQRAAKRPLTAE